MLDCLVTESGDSLFVGRDAFGELVDIDMADRDGTYFCPNCGAELIQRRGRIRLHCFAHKNLDDCLPSGEPMTQWHLDWQRMFPEECREITADSGGVRHRADVIVGNIVLEFQHSAITDDKWEERTEFYQDEMDKHVFWVYDRTTSSIHDDLSLNRSLHLLSGEYFGNDGLPRREFARCDSICGSDLPVFLDYGNLVVMCSGFRKLRKWWCANTCMLLTRDKFVELVRHLGVYPSEFLDDSGISDYIFEHEDWFLENLKQVALILDDRRVFRLVDAYGKYVVSCSAAVDVSSYETAPCVSYVTSAKGDVRMSRFLWESHFYDDFADIKESFLASCSGGSCLRCFDIMQVDVRMISNGLVYMF